ncbi:MAG TPA: M1 family aminopeptidase [candidate division Zixibacteria bacterium]|nr:M1 family aminopeptidase [candidate division Zixibacteria bacterium]
MKRVFLVVLAVIGLGALAAAQRLPETAVPSSYDLKFEPNLAQATFTGDETVHVRVLKPTSTITLNALDIQFQDATVSAAGITQKAQVEPDPANEQVTLKLAKQIPAGDADIHIRYTGTLNDKNIGFYLSKTARRRYAATQFESTDARRAFPSFDEPVYKAVFNVTLVVDKGDTAISNSSIVSDTPGPGDGKHTIKFSATPKMSSYLVAMVVGDFVCREGGADGIPMRVCSIPEEKDMTGFALEASENILKFYNRYYSIKYPFKKLDHVVLPDFGPGAMENVGAITYRDTEMLIDPKTASYDAKREVASVIAHEMAHQWFGDLVTAQWWNDIWLNEGFATWMSYKPLEAWKPEWHENLNEILESVDSLKTDSIASVRTIRADAETPGEIQALFDGIAYGKAASVLRMVEAYVGPEVFRQGVNAYLQKHAYANATAEDFWTQIAQTSGKPVDKIMKSFTEQPGAPLISVKSTCSGGRTQVTMRQDRYIADSQTMAAGSPQLWTVPVSLRGSDGKVVYHLLTKREETFDLPECSEWVDANAGGRGYYRTNYEAQAFAKMRDAVLKAFSPEERLRMPSDAWAMVQVGKMNIGDYLELLRAMQGERSRPIVEAMNAQMNGIHDEVVAPADRPAFEKWVRSQFKPMASDLQQSTGTPTGGELDALKSDIFEILARDGRDPELVAKARATVEEYMKDPASVDPELAGKALAVTAINGDAALYEQYVAHLATAKTPQEYNAYLQSLGKFPEKELAKRTFEIILSPEVKSQNAFRLFPLMRNYEVQPTAWELFKQNFPKLEHKVGIERASFFAEVSSVFCDPMLRDDSQKFFAERNLPGTKRTLENAKEKVNSCIQVRELQQKNLSTYLQQQQQRSGE